MEALEVRTEDEVQLEVTDRNKRSVFTELWSYVVEGWTLIAIPPGRTLDQNRKMWAMLRDVSKQVIWFERKLLPIDWKDLFTAYLQREHLDMVPSLDHKGFVILGTRTSRMSKRRFAELIELIYWFGAEHDVVWSEKAQALWNEEIVKLTEMRAKDPEPPPGPPARVLPFRRKHAG